MRAAVEESRAELGPIEILVNNAGWDELIPFLETDEPFWDRVIEINFKGCLRLTRDALPGDGASGAGDGSSTSAPMRGVSARRSNRSTRARRPA